MKFNTYYGQMRPSQTIAGRPVTMYHRHITPKSILTMEHDPGEPGVEYRANDIGVIEINDAKHIADFLNLGYPVYVGPDDGTPVKPEHLEFLRYPMADSEGQRSALTEAEHVAYRDFLFSSYLAEAGKRASQGNLTARQAQRYVDVINAASAGFILTAEQCARFTSLVKSEGE